MTDEIKDTGNLQGSDYEVGYKKPPKSTRFKPGDPKINRKGRPKTFDMARELAQQIGHEVLKGEGDKPVVRDSGIVTRIEGILREWSISRNFQKQREFMAYAVGKPKEEHEHSGNVTVSWKEFISGNAKPDSE